MACGTPVIGTNQGGIPDFLIPDVGILVPVEDEIKLANAIEKILNGYVKFNRNKIANYAKENYSQDILINHLIEVYLK